MNLFFYSFLYIYRIRLDRVNFIIQFYNLTIIKYLIFKNNCLLEYWIKKSKRTIWSNKICDKKTIAENITIATRKSSILEICQSKKHNNFDSNLEIRDKLETNNNSIYKIIEINNKIFQKRENKNWTTC